MDESDRNVNLVVEGKWLKLGVVLAVLHYLFLVFLLVLLEIDQYLAVAVVLGVSIVGGVALMIFVLYVY